jgi:hypothetical protein
MSKAGLHQILWAAAMAGALILAAQAGETVRPAPRQPERTAASAPAAKATLDLSYDLRIWFIPFGHTTYRGVFTNNNYQVSSYFKTSGLVSVFWQAEIDAGASGNVGAHTVAPYMYDSYYRRGSEHKQRVKLTYKPNAPPDLFAAPPYNTKKYPVTREEQEGGVDPMSAVTLVISGVKADTKNPCGTIAPVFDGRRRYNMEFTYIRDRKVKLDDGLYTGTAHLCRVHYHQIAGYKPKMLKEGQKWPPIFALLGDVPDARAPLGRYIVPLRVWAKTDWGTVTAELSKLKTGGAAPKPG